MSFIRTGLVAALLLAPSISEAETLTLLVTDDGELAATFGLLPFRLSSPVESDTQSVSGTVLIVSGPLISQTVDEVNGVTRYHYGAGQLTLDLSGWTDGGTSLSGRFEATTDPFQIDVEEDADELFGGGLADDFFIELGRGRFDPALAGLLQVRRTSMGGWMDLGLEDIDGEPDDATREGFDHRGQTVLSIPVTSVPEPSMLSLCLLAAGWMVHRARHRP